MKNTALLALMVVMSSVLPTVQAQTQTSPAAGSTPFYDVVDPNAPDYTAIQYLKNQKIVQGYPDGSFQPNNDISRAEFVKIVVGALGLPLKETECGFPDVATTEWFATYVCAGKKANLISGFPDGSFKPSEKIKFSESSKIVTNAFKLTAKTDPNIWYRGYVDALSAKKAIPLTVKFFDDNLTRSGMAQMMYRLKANVTTEASRNYSEINGEGFVKVDTCKELQDRLLDEQYDPAFNTSDRDTTGNIPKDAPNAATEGSGSSSGGTVAAPQYSETNLQVAGVDEADIVKTDGKYIYLVKNDTIRIVEAYPVENMKELVRLKLGDATESFYPNEMYVKENQMVLIGNYYNYAAYDEAYPTEGGASSSFVPPYYNGNRTRVYILDIADRKSPSITRTIDFEANSFTSRKINNMLYLVLNQYIPTYPYPPYPIPYYKSAPTIYTPAQMLNPEEIMPTMHDSKKNVDEKIANCSDVTIFPKPGYSANFLIVAGISLDNLNQDVSRKVLVANTSNVYVSQNNLFVTDTDWSGGIRPLTDIYNPYPVDTEKTAVYKFSMNNGSVDFVARGSVDGHVQNQFSMDEFDSNFRIATTKQEYYPVTKTSNNLYVLDTNMKTIGSITDIAPGETIYSTRFVGKRGYMVTFRQVDPLFIADLSDPKNPKLAGTLKIPGYSTYLHPYDENHIIGFGNEVDSTNALVGGLKMAMFDVSDLNNPKETAKEIIGQQGSTSDVLYNHKALLFDKEKNLLALPVTVYENGATSNVCSQFKYSACPTTCQKVCVPTNCTIKDGIQICTTDCDGENSCMDPYTPSKAVFQGAYVYTVDPAKGFQLKGKITHFTAADIKAGGEYWYPDYYKSVQRILYIGDYLYTVSLSVVKANQISDLSEKKMTVLGD